MKQERELEDEEEKRIQAEEELEQSQGMDLTYEKWVKNLLQFHFVVRLFFLFKQARFTFLVKDFYLILFYNFLYF